MNYRHIFHAGNISDVVKHCLLNLLLDALLRKEKAFCVIDTHAGCGLYDLHDERAEKTKEAEAGIMRFLSAQPLAELESLYKIFQFLNPSWSPGSQENFRFYPGSTVLAQHRLRPIDRLIGCELHPEDVQLLKRSCKRDTKVQIHARDGYQALNALLPPAEKRGVVFIDPPFEDPNEFDRLTEALQTSAQRWPQGIHVAWYPIKDRPAIWKFHESLARSPIKDVVNLEFIYDNEPPHDRLQGCGFILVNAPFNFADAAKLLFLHLHQALKTQFSETKLERLTEE